MKVLLVFTLLSFNALALNIGDTAPAFSLPAENSKSYSLSDFKGKVVVLEWLNHGCPFVRKHYDSQNMQKTQNYTLGKEVVWLSIISSAPGKQGHVNAKQALLDKITNKSLAQHILLDPQGKVGKLYGARTTPHMYIVGTDGKLLYQGAIDSIASADRSDIEKATNYVKKAIEELSVGKKISLAKTRPYGCSVKY